MAAKDFLLPDLGEGLEEAEVVTWRVAEGDEVELNQPLVEMNTAKALVEIPSPFAGRVVKLHAAEGDVVPVGKPLVTIDVGGQAAPAEVTQEAAQAAFEAPPKRRPVLVGYGVADDEPQTGAGAGAGAGAARTPARGGPVAASPPVRRLAKDLGVDIGALAGTGPGGRVTREDVEKAAGGETAAETGTDARAASPAPHAGAGADADADADAERVPVRGTRRLIAEKMARSTREIPHVTTFVTVDAHWLEEFRRDVKDASGERISPLPVIVRALAETCREHPKLNASFDAERSEIVLYRRCNVGIATDTERGLLVPVVRDAGSKGILQIARDIAELSRAARESVITAEQMAGGTVTVTNVGTFGAEYGTPIINYPEAAILAVGVIEPRALVVDGEVAARPAMTLSLSFDHRLLDGAEAGRALRDLARFLESPFRLGSLPR